MKTKVLIWAGDKVKHNFMRAAGVFEPHKLLVESIANPLAYEIELDDSPQLVAKELPLRVEAWRQALWDKTVVAAIYVAGYPGYSWVDPTCWQVSDGYKWALLSDTLKHFGWVDAPPPLTLGGFVHRAMKTLSLNPVTRQGVDILVAVDQDNLAALSQLCDYLPCFPYKSMTARAALRRGNAAMLDLILRAITPSFGAYSCKRLLAELLVTLALPALATLADRQEIARVLVDHGADLSVLDQVSLRNLSLPKSVLVQAAKRALT